MLAAAICLFFAAAAPPKTTPPPPDLAAALKPLKFREIGPAVMGGRIDDVAVVESDPDIVYVATASGGVMKTINGGTTWEPVFDNETSSTIGAVAVAPSDPSIVWVGTGESNNRQSSSWGNGVYKSTDAGASWKKLEKGLPWDPDAKPATPPADPQAVKEIGRIGVSFNRRDPSVVYALLEHANGGIFRSDDKGETWTKMSDTNPRGSYYSQVRIDPNNDQRVWVLGAQMFVSDDGGRTFKSNIVQRIHGDYHALWIDPRDSNHMITGSDGGIHFSRDRGRTWDYTNNVPIGQFYEVGLDMQ